ncbi:hypothetical protein M9H77_14082 [Catharanthus roseus]|uniref:Uncharacterized protein n=1 Tax=Catharanthus roseus TaxID=4058 RepID=A0ACC0BM74_CATRO|nr:hypothetical protein M9H77_14082 [Catharanthus roseus]
MFQHATSATSWGRIWISIIHFPLKSCALLPTPFITLLPVPSTRIRDLTMNLSKILIENGCTQFWASSQSWLKYLISLLTINSTRAFKGNDQDRPPLNRTYCLHFVNESHS